MKLNSNNLFFLALFIALFGIACNNKDKKAERANTMENTDTVSAMKTTPAATEETIDAAKVASNFYKVVADTLGIRVLEATYKPGDSSVMHSHPVNAFYTIQGSTAAFTLKDGSTNTLEMKTGMSGIRGYDLHSVKNIGKTTLKVLLVEVNRPATIVPQDPATDATKVAPEEYKVLHDSLGIRMLEVNYKPGQASAMHSHPDVVVYAVNGGKAELTSKDGTKNVNEVKSGMAWVSPSDTHSGKNIGKTPYKLILFEVNRARN